MIAVVSWTFIVVGLKRTIASCACGSMNCGRLLLEEASSRHHCLDQEWDGLASFHCSGLERCSILFREFYEINLRERERISRIEI